RAAGADPLQPCPRKSRVPRPRADYSRGPGGTGDAEACRRGVRSAMQVIDAQIHLWGSGLPSNRSHRQVTAFTPEEAVALMDEGGIDAAGTPPPGWDPNSTELAFQAVQNYPGRFAIMGAVPLDWPESRDHIASWRQQPGMLGLRYGFLTDPARRRLHD